MNETTLLEKARKGDKKSLSLLLQNNYHIVYGFMLKMAKNEEIAKDLTQEAMVKAILNIKKFKGKSKFSTWLISIASNTYKDALKKKKITEIDIDKTPLRSHQNVEDEIIAKDKAEKLKKILMNIPENQRRIFILKHYYDYSYDEISKIVDCPKGTVRSRLHYCIKKIKDELEVIQT